MIAAEKKSQNAPHLRLGGSQAEVFAHTATWVVCSYMYVSDRHSESGVLPDCKKMIILLQPQDSSERRVEGECSHFKGGRAVLFLGVLMDKQPLSSVNRPSFWYDLSFPD